MTKAPFLPPKLPPQIAFDRLVPEIAKAHSSIGKLDALLSQLKNPRLLSRTLVAREAVMSSQIEGTQATLSEVLEQEARGITREATPKEQDIREIMNYRRALEQGVEVLKDRPLTENVIKELHAILLQSVRGHSRGPGEFRRKLVFIGEPGAGIEQATYVPPLPDAIPELMSGLERYIHSEERDTLVQIGITHYQFEAIHPFEDGNGRIGRLLISLLLYQKKLLAYPYIYLSEFFEEHRREYYDLLLGVSEHGAWEEWLAFFLRGLDLQVRKAQESSQAILHLHETLKAKVRELNSMYAHEFLDVLFENPFLSFRTIRARSEIKNAQTLSLLIGKFRNAGIISDATPRKKRNKIYRFDALLELLQH